MSAPAPPELDYLPAEPDPRTVKIGMIGCGAIAGAQLEAYAGAGYRVVALCDPNVKAAEDRRNEFYPDARVFPDYRALLAETDVDIVDVTTHTAVRPPIVADALRSGRHVLSQKPFVEDLRLGAELCDLADECGVRLAVNHSARWAPHFSGLRAAVGAGLLGAVTAADFAVFWAHDRGVAGSLFADMHDLILFDFGIHWFDLVAIVLAGRGAPRLVSATVAPVAGQQIAAPCQAQVIIDFDEAQASLVFRGASQLAELGGFRVSGSAGVATTTGSPLHSSHLDLITADGDFRLPLEGAWNPNGFRGTMAELMQAIEQGRRPGNDARTALDGLALCFAAVASARRGQAVVPGEIEQLSEAMSPNRR